MQNRLIEPIRGMNELQAKSPICPIKSSFSHPSGAVQLTSHPDGFAGLWFSLADRDVPFPAELLTDARQTLRQFVDSSEEQ